MPKRLSLLIFLGYYTLIQGVFLNTAIAQITPDRNSKSQQSRLLLMQISSHFNNLFSNASL